MWMFLFLIVMLGLSLWVKINFAAIKGKSGEKRISKLLNKLEPEKYIVLNDLYIPKKDGSTTQIDHIVISYKGLFVIETKNYNGWIIGTENSQFWTQVIYKRREKLYNPVWQNAGHIRALQEYLGDSLTDIPVHSVIVFGKQATLKFNTVFNRAKVIKSKDLLSVIHNSPASNKVSDFKRQKIKQILSSLYTKDRKEQKKQSEQHIRDIKERKIKRDIQVSLNLCPQCGGQLVERKGKHGTFKGCSNFPKCRYTTPL